MLNSFGQHHVLLSVQSAFLAFEFLLAFLDDIYFVIQPTCEVHGNLRVEFWEHSRIRINQEEDPDVEPRSF